jgi:hypothetical protein
MPIYFGTTDNTNLYLGTTPIETVYLGTTVVYESSYNLGTEIAQNFNDGFGETGSVSATARFTFNTNGTVTAVAGTSSPYTNWNIVGGTHISYRIVSSTTSGSPAWTAPMADSNDGSVRVSMASARAFIISASASAAQAAGQELNGYTYVEALDRTIEVWVWNAASGGKVLAKGTYQIIASASFAYTGAPE